jgi:hypothetical protein
MREPFGLADYHASRFICEPLHLLDYCRSASGIALILTSAERGAISRSRQSISQLRHGDDACGFDVPPDDYGAARRPARRAAWPA